MSEGRKAQVCLLDDRKLDILVQPKLYANELLDLVSSHFNLKEKEYFGLSFKDVTGHHYWLQLDRKVLEHEFPKKMGILVLFFSVRFFIESIGYLRDSITIELFYLQAQQNIFKGLIEADSCTVFELAAHVLQANHSDYTHEQLARDQMKKLNVLPCSALEEHPSLIYAEDQTLIFYQRLVGMTRGSAIVSYMHIVESLPTYGIHYYEVRDKAGLPWWLGLSYKGISQFDLVDKKTPRRVFAWKQLENLYFRDKKFSIEVHDPKRVSVSRRTFGPGNVNVHAWFAVTAALTKCIWSMAVSQHQFYLDRKQSKSQLPVVRSVSEIAADLCQSSTSIPSSSSVSGNMSHSGSAHSLSYKNDFSLDDTKASRKAQEEMFDALTSKRKALEEALKLKTEELKKICLQEAELTGIMPPDIPLSPGEKLPEIRRRVTTEFSLPTKLLNNADQTSQEEAELHQIELEFAIQDKITKAAYKLSHDQTLPKRIKKRHRQSYERAILKLKELSQKLNDNRMLLGIEPLSFSEPPILLSPLNSPAPSRSAFMKVTTSPQVEVVELDPSVYPKCYPAYSSSINFRQHNSYSGLSVPSPSLQRHYSGGYMPNSVYTTRTQYRTQAYPTFSSRNSASGHSSPADYDNMPNNISHSNNLYNLSRHQMSRYESNDELLSPTSGSCDSFYSPGQYVSSNFESSGGNYDSRYSRPNCHQDISSLSHGSPHMHIRNENSTSFTGQNFVDNGHQTFPPPAHIRRDPEYSFSPPSQQSESSSNSSWFESTPRTPRQQKPPSTPQFDLPQSSFLHLDPYIRDANPLPDQPNGNALFSPLKMQNFVEVSKPFETADVYKYSEKLRRQRLSSNQSVFVDEVQTSSSPYSSGPNASRPSSRNASRPTSPYFHPVASYSHHLQHSYSTSAAEPPSSLLPSTVPRSHSSSRIENRISSPRLDAGPSLASSFSQEMLAWYDDHQPVVNKTKPATLV